MIFPDGLSYQVGSKNSFSFVDIRRRSFQQIGREVSAMECQVIEELRYKASAFEIAKAVLGYSGDKGAGERLGVLFDPV